MGFRNLFPIPTAGDWNAVRRAFTAIQHALGIESQPTFDEVTTDGDANIGGDLIVDGDTTFTGSFVVTGDVTFTGGIEFDSDLDMNCHEITNVLVHTVADEAEMFTLTCGQGQMCFRQDTDKFYGRL